MNKLVASVLFTLVSLDHARAAECEGLTERASVTVTSELQRKFRSDDMNHYQGNLMEVDEVSRERLESSEMIRLIDGVPLRLEGRRIIRGTGTDREVFASIPDRYGRILDLAARSPTGTAWLLTETHLLEINFPGGALEESPLRVEGLGLTKVRLAKDGVFFADDQTRILRLRDEFPHLEILVQSWGKVVDFAVEGPQIVILQSEELPNRRLSTVSYFDLEQPPNGRSRPDASVITIPDDARSIDFDAGTVLVGSNYGLNALGVMTRGSRRTFHLERVQIYLPSEPNILAVSRVRDRLVTVVREHSPTSATELRSYHLRDIKEDDRYWLRLNEAR